MTTSFPAALDSYSLLVDDVDDVVAADVNNRGDAIVAMQTAAFRMALATQKYVMLPGLVGFWPMSSIAMDTFAVYDMSGQGRTLTLAGNPFYKVLSPTTYAVPYIDFDGTGDYLTRADEAGLDILGTEANYATANRGLTMGCWVQLDDGTPAASNYVMSKRGAAGQLAYFLVVFTDGTVFCQVSSDGTATTQAQTTGTVGTGWVFVAMRFVPSTSLDVYLGVGGALEKATNVTSIPAAIFNGNGAFNISGFNNGTNLLSGNVALPFLCAQQLSDEVLGFLFQNTRGLFGV